MKRKVQLLLMAMLLPFLKSTAQDTIRCVHDQYLQEHQDSNPRSPDISDIISYGAKRWRERNPNFTFYPKPQPAPPCDICMTIDPACFKSRYALPVIVHIVAKPGDTIIGQGSNIPNSQVHNALAVLNRQFAGYGIPDNHAVAVNTGIQFYLAPVGADSSGIIRYNNVLSSVAPLVFAPLRNLIDSPLNINQYIHIFVVDTITAQGIMGYASYPQTGFNHAVVVTRKMFGDASKPCTDCQLHSQSRNKTLAHELGHFLGLRHTFEGGCAPANADCETQGDGCCDTPPAESPNFFCPVGRNSCPSTPIPDQIQNFMDYTSEACAKWFTRNQAERMYHSLETYKQELINIENLIIHRPDICLFSARFRIPNPVVCDTGDMVQFRALPYTNSGVQYIWTIYDSTQTVVFDTTLSSVMLSPVEASTFQLPNQSTLQLPKGKYDVRLQVAYNNDTATEYIPQALWVVTCDAALSHEGGNWFFGQHAGLVFTETGVRPSLNALFPSPTINTGEGCISLSDSLGNLMFYGGGDKFSSLGGRLYNSQHTILNASYYLPMHISGTSVQNSIAFACPFAADKMMLVQNSADGDGRLSYTLLKKNTSGTYVLDTASVNTPILLPGYPDTAGIHVGEYLTAAPKCNGKGYWLAVVLSDIYSTHNYLTILSVDTNGIYMSDSVFLYTMRLMSGIYYHETGQAKFSPDATKLALCNAVFEFDRNSGTLGQKRTIPLLDEWLIYGLSFSPNSRYLFSVQYDTVKEYLAICRTDLSHSSLTVRSIDAYPDDDEMRSLQLGPDNRLYITSYKSPELGVVNYPDKTWTDVPNPLGFEPYGVPLQIGGTGGTSLRGLPNFVEAKRPDEIRDTIYYTISNCNTATFSTTACCRNSYLWLFGDGDTSMQQYPEPHTYARVGVYHVKLVLDGSDTVRVTVPLFNPKVRISGDTLLCNENQYATYTALDIDSFSKNYQLHWKIKDGTYSLNYATSNTIEPVFDALPAQVIVHVTDPATECEARDTITVNQIAELATNKINNGIPSFASCSPAGTFSLEGNTPSGGGTFYYSWYYSYNNQDWVDMEQYTQNLTNQPLERTIYVKRLVYPDACENWSNTVKVVPVIRGNNIFPLIPLYDERNCDPLFSGTLITNLRSDTVLSYDDPAHSYYFQWQVSVDGYAWTDIESYKSSIGYGGWDWRYSSRSLERRFADHEPYMYIRKIVAASSYTYPYPLSCYDTSNVVKIVNYNIDSMRAIRLHAYDPDIIHGEIPPIEPDSLFKVTWQTSCNGTDWTDIEEGFNHDTLWGVQSLGAEFVRRKIVKLTNQGFTYCDSLLSNVLECNPLRMQPVSQVVQIGEYATFYLDYSSADPFAIQWQQYNPSTSSWDNIAGATSAELRIHANKCNDDTLFRALITNACRSLITDSVALHVINNHSHFFLWLKDLPSDTAREPNIEVSAKNNYFGSPDIAASNTVTVVNGRLTMITVLDRELDLYVTVRNKGTDTSGGGELYLYASLSGLNPEWNFSFTDTLMTVVRNTLPVKNYFVPGTLPYLPTEGTPVNSEGIPIPDIPPGDSVRIHYRWTNPPEHFVQNYFSRSGSVYPTSNAVIYLARITECSSYPFEMSYPELIFSSTSVQGSTKVNIKQNAKVAALHCYTLPVHNDAVSPFNPSQMQPDIVTMVSSKKVLPIDIGVDVDSANAFFDNAEMYVFFDDVLWDAFVAGGNIGGGYTVVEDGVFRVSNYGAVFWSNMFLDTGVVGHAGFSFYYKTGEDTSGALINNKFRVFLTEDSQEQGSLSLYVDSKLKGINGGQAMMIPAQPQDAADKHIAGAQSHAKESAIASTIRTPQVHEPATDEFVFSFRPNPFSRELFVRVSNAEPAAVISLSDMNGKVVYEHVLSGESRTPYYEFAIPAQTFAEGVYLLSYQSPTRKVVKKAVLLR